MEFLPHVVDGTLRVITFSINAGKQDNVEMNGYLISKGWKRFTWFRIVGFVNLIINKSKLRS